MSMSSDAGITDSVVISLNGEVVHDSSKPEPEPVLETDKTELDEPDTDEK